MEGILENLGKNARYNPRPVMGQAAQRSAINFAFRLLSRRNYTRRELTLKLLQRGFEEKTMDRVVAECERLHYLDDEAFARTYRKQMTEKGYGARYIQMAMKKKGFTDRDIAVSFSDYDMVADECTVAQTALVKKVKTLGHLPEDLKKREKLYRFLCSRGFSTSTVHEVLDTSRTDA
jgi:regulatory protein